MNVTFRGLANVGAYTAGGLSKNTTTDKLVFQVNNFGENNDLEDFKEVLEAFPDPYKKNFINMEFRTLDNGNCGIYINSKPFYKFSSKSSEYEPPNPVINEKKWDIIKKISTVLERIKNGNESFILQNPYVKSDECKDRLDIDIMKLDAPSEQKLIEQSHNPENLKVQGKIMHKKLRANIQQYLYDEKRYTNQIESISGFYLQTTLPEEYMKIMIKLPEDAIKKFGSRYDSYRKNNSQVIRINIKKQPNDKEPSIGINQYSAPINKENKAMLSAISEKLKEIAKDEHTLPLPYMFKTDKHLDVLYEGFDTNGMKQITFMDDDEKEARGVDFELYDNSNDLKDLARKMAKVIDKELDKG